MRASLHHVHLPKLDAVGLVDYDAEAAVVARTDVDAGGRIGDLLAA